MRSVREQTAKRSNDRIDRLAAKRRESVDQNHLAAEPRGFDCGGNAGDAGTDHADIRFHPAQRSAAAAPPNDLRADRNTRRSRHAFFSLFRGMLVFPKSLKKRDHERTAFSKGESRYRRRP
jgi:hypothetical protein